MAERAGHTVEVLFRIHAYGIDGYDERRFAGMELALDQQRARRAPGRMAQDPSAYRPGNCLPTGARNRNCPSCACISCKALGFINTLMLQDVLAGPEWSDVLGDADRRGITPLFHTNTSPYGDVQLNLNRRLDLAAARPPSDDEEGNSP